MGKRVTIEVTEADIEQAVPKDSGHCAIADAIARQIPGAANVTVDLQTIRWSDRDKGKRYVYLTPRVAQILLLDFDRGDRDRCEPLTFRLIEPVQVVPIRGKNPETRNKEQAGRVAALRVKRDAGEELTQAEKIVLTRSDNRVARPPRPPRPTTPGPRKVEFTAGKSADGDPAGAVTVHGGREAPLAALAHGRGRRRVFGLKSAGT